MKKALILISVGLFNFLHGMLHIVQFIQSILLVAYSTDTHNLGKEGWVDKLLHNPFFAFFWAAIGIMTFVIGVKDYKHHRKCSHK